MRVREELRGLGFTWRIPYKTDEATLEGCCQVRGHNARYGLQLDTEANPTQLVPKISSMSLEET